MTNKKYNFTLIEMMCVIMGIFMLAGITLMSVRTINNKAYSAQTEAIIGHVRAGLEAYKAEFGFYPPAPYASPMFIPINKDMSEQLDLESVNQFAFPLFGGLFYPVDPSRGDANAFNYYYQDFDSREAQLFMRSSGIEELYKHVKPMGWTSSWTSDVLEVEPEDPDDVDAQNRYQAIREKRSSKHWRRGVAVVDAWGAPLYYRSPGVLNPGGYDLFSNGSDGRVGAGRTRILRYEGSDNLEDRAWFECRVNTGGRFTGQENEDGESTKGIFFLSPNLDAQKSYFSNLIGDDIGTF